VRTIGSDQAQITIPRDEHRLRHPELLRAVQIADVFDSELDSVSSHILGLDCADIRDFFHTH
jgi:hypothetical protein